MDKTLDFLLFHVVMLFEIPGIHECFFFPLRTGFIWLHTQVYAEAERKNAINLNQMQRNIYIYIYNIFIIPITERRATHFLYPSGAWGDGRVEFR